MNDAFIERMVKKKRDSKDLAIALLCVLAIFVLGFASLLFIPNFAIFIVAGLCFGAYKLITMRNLEFEYSLTNGFIAIDKIINRASRKRLTAFECKDIESMGDYEKNKARLQNMQVQTRIFASKDSVGTDAWYILVNTNKTGKTLIVFNPDDDMLDAIKRFMPSHLRFEVFGRGK